MFRYLAMIAEAPSEAAAPPATWALSRAMDARPGWRCALRLPGVQVFVHGERPGTNDACALPLQRGVIVGRLFRREGPAPLRDDDFAAMAEGGCAPLVQACWGRYVAFVCPPAEGGIWVVRDPSGTLPCFVLRQGGVWLVCSWLEDALTLLPERHHPRPDVDGIRAFLAFGSLSGRRTAVAGVEQVLPGERAWIRGITMERQTLWCPIEVANGHSPLRGAEAAVALRDTVRTCVRQWSSLYRRVVLRLSGGVDSSILASCLAAGEGQPDVLCLNYRSSDPASDERHYARLAAARAQRPLREVEAERAIRLDALLDLPRTPVPRSHVGALGMARVDAAVAADFGATAMFSGVGGDLVFFELHECWPLADYLALHGLDGGFAQAALGAARLGGVSVWHALATALRDRWGPSRAASDPGHGRSLLSDHTLAIAQNGAAYRHPVFEQAGRLPVGKLQQIRQLAYPVDYYEPLAFESAPEPVRPLLAQPVVELALRLPTFVLTEGGQGRALARRAFARDIPEEIARRRTKGMTGQSVKEMLTRNLSFARALLIDGELMRWGLIDELRVREALSDRPSALATPYSELNTLLSVEAWLRCWARSRPGAARGVVLQ